MAIKDSEAGRHSSCPEDKPDQAPGDCLLGSHCPGLLTGVQVRSWSGGHAPGALGPVLWAAVSLIQNRTSSCSQSQLVAWPGGSCHRSLLGLPPWKLHKARAPLAPMQERLFSFPLSFKGPLEGGEEPPQTKGQEGRAGRWQGGAGCCPLGGSSPLVQAISLALLGVFLTH